MEELRDKLNLMLESDEYSKEEIIRVSQDLDRFIVQYYTGIRFNSLKML